MINNKNIFHWSSYVGHVLPYQYIHWYFEKKGCLSIWKHTYFTESIPQFSLKSKYNLFGLDILCGDKDKA